MSETDLPEPGTAYEDDLEIDDDERLFRIIPAGSFKYDNEGSVTGTKSEAFQDASAEVTIEYGYPAVGMSVHIESIMQSHDLSPDEHLLVGKHSNSGLASLTVGEIREEGQGIVLKPEPDLPAHALVFTKQGPRKNRRVRKNLSSLAAVLREPYRV